MRKCNEPICGLYIGQKGRNCEVGAQQAITREVEALEQNARPRTCFDAVVEDLAPTLP